MLLYLIPKAEFAHLDTFLTSINSIFAKYVGIYISLLYSTKIKETMYFP